MKYLQLVALGLCLLGNIKAENITARIPYPDFRGQPIGPQGINKSKTIIMYKSDKYNLPVLTNVLKGAASIMHHNNTVHVIYVGPNTAAFAAGRSIITNFIANMSATTWFDVMRQYYTDSGYTKEYVQHVFMGQEALIDSGIYQNKILSSSIEPLIMNSGLPKDDVKSMYLVITSPEVTVTVDTHNTLQLGKDNFCGFHSWFRDVNTGKDLKFAMVAVPNGNGNCQYVLNRNASPNGNVPLDATVTLIAHEILETIIQPRYMTVYSWSEDYNWNEIIDKCEDYLLDVEAVSNQPNAHFNIQVGTRKYLVPPIFDSSISKCAMKRSK